MNAQIRKAEKETNVFLDREKKSHFSSDMFILSLQTNLRNDS